MPSNSHLTTPNPRFNPRKLMIWLCPAILTIAGVRSLQTGLIPPGVPGEWEWQKPNTVMTLNEWLMGAVTVVIYLLFIGLGGWLVRRGRTPATIAIILLFPAAACVQVGLQMAAPSTFGLAKWAMCTFYPASSGYYTVAANEVEDLPKFLENYPEWIQKQDALHIGTHPPGLIVEAKSWLLFWQQRPDGARLLLRNLVNELRPALVMLVPGKKFPDFHLAAIASISITHWLLCALAGWPVFLMIRRLGFSQISAWLVAAIWPVVPSAVMFQPASDIAFPLISISAFYLSLSPANSSRTFKQLIVESLICGLLLAIGMFMSLVFLAVGLIIALLLLMQPDLPWNKRVYRILAVGAGFAIGTLLWAVLTKSNPFVIWYYNQINHGRFYIEYPRTYTKWILADLIELSFGLGIPITYLIGVSIIQIVRNRELGKYKHLIFILTSAVMAVLMLSGKSLSEVSRLWMPFFPVMLVPVGALIEKMEWKISFSGWLILELMIMIIWMQSFIQVVYSF